MKNKLVYLIGIIAAAGLSRLLPHPWNFSPLVGITLMGGALISNRKLSFLLPLAIWLFTDLLVNAFIYAKPLTDLSYFITSDALGVYLSMLMIWGIGLLMSKRLRFSTILAGTIASSLLFYIVTNTAVFLGSPYYEPSLAGWLQCMYMGIPFYQSPYGTLFGSFFFNGIMGDLFYSGMLFGSWYYINRRAFVPAIA
ncbi:MAG: hypothetical protein IAE67_04265 [Candidatus Competibacteraceae bacterium]|nr:hypothetical protein [Candidatus Competibacteraceae bacterium]